MSDIAYVYCFFTGPGIKLERKSYGVGNKVFEICVQRSFLFEDKCIVRMEKIK